MAHSFIDTTRRGFSAPGDVSGRVSDWIARGTGRGKNGTRRACRGTTTKNKSRNAR